MRSVALVFLALIAVPALAQTTTNSTPGSSPKSTPGSNEAVEEIGFDAKTKRDPNGKKLDEKATETTTASPEKTLRNDKKLRSDTEILKSHSTTSNAGQPGNGAAGGNTGGGNQLSNNPSSFTVQKSGQTMTPHK